MIRPRESGAPKVKYVVRLHGIFSFCKRLYIVYTKVDNMIQ